MQQPESSQASVNRPSLMSTSAQNDTASDRILAALETGNGETSLYYEKRKSSFGWGRLVFVALAIMTSTAGWMAYQNERVAILDGFKSIKEETSPVVEHTVASVESDQASVKLPETEDLTAVINNELAPENGLTLLAGTAPGSDPTSDDPIATLLSASNREDHPKKPTDELLKALEEPSAADGRASAKPAATAHAKNQGTAGKKTSDADKPIQKPSTRQASQASSAKPDTDVALLTALMAAGNEREPVRAAALKTKEIRAKTGQFNRDIVERTASDSSETLLARCKQLGFLEGELCRWRICSGRWETDLACKVF